MSSVVEAEELVWLGVLLAFGCLADRLAYLREDLRQGGVIFNIGTALQNRRRILRIVVVVFEEYPLTRQFGSRNLTFRFVKRHDARTVERTISRPGLFRLKLCLASPRRGVFGYVQPVVRFAMESFLHSSFGYRWLNRLIILIEEAK